MTYLEKKKQEAIRIYYRDKWTAFEDELLCNIFDAGAKAQKDLIIEAIKNIGIDNLIDESDWYEIFGENK